MISFSAFFLFGNRTNKHKIIFTKRSWRSFFSSFSTIFFPLYALLRNIKISFENPSPFASCKIHKQNYQRFPLYVLKRERNIIYFITLQFTSVGSHCDLKDFHFKVRKICGGFLRKKRKKVYICDALFYENTHFLFKR